MASNEPRRHRRGKQHEYDCVTWFSRRSEIGKKLAYSRKQTNKQTKNKASEAIVKIEESRSSGFPPISLSKYISGPGCSNLN